MNQFTAPAKPSDDSYRIDYQPHRLESSSELAELGVNETIVAGQLDDAAELIVIGDIFVAESSESQPFRIGATQA